MTCPDCNYQWIPAKSKRLVVCPNCDHLERTGESLVAMKKRKARESAAASAARSAAKMKKAVPKELAKFSKKGKAQATQVTAMKARVKEGAADGDSFVRCEGCYRYFKGLDASHKVSLARSAELAASAENIRLLCRECHMKWESSVVTEMIELRCFEEDMEYLLDFDPERFWKIFHRLLDEQALRPTSKLEAIISRLEKLE